MDLIITILSENLLQITNSFNVSNSITEKIPQKKLFTKRSLNSPKKADCRTSSNNGLLDSGNYRILLPNI